VAVERANIVENNQLLKQKFKLKSKMNKSIRIRSSKTILKNLASHKDSGIADKRRSDQAASARQSRRTDTLSLFNQIAESNKETTSYFVGLRSHLSPRS
jgi:hypothetical protein